MRRTGRSAPTGSSSTARRGRRTRWRRRSKRTIILMIWLQVEEMEQMDIPLELRDTSMYCATSAHKINHSFQPNCRFSRFNHPRLEQKCVFDKVHYHFSEKRFGPLPCVTTTQQVKAGEELFSYYRFTQSEIQPHDFRMYTVQDAFLFRYLLSDCPEWYLNLWEQK